MGEKIGEVAKKVLLGELGEPEFSKEDFDRLANELAQARPQVIVTFYKDSQRIEDQYVLVLDSQRHWLLRVDVTGQPISSMVNKAKFNDSTNVYDVEKLSSRHSSDGILLELFHILVYFPSLN